MATSLHEVDRDRCRAEGICVEICPKGVLEMHEGFPRTRQDRVDGCIRCGQCVAVCPNESMVFTDSAMGTVAESARWDFTDAQFQSFLEERRSIRLFSDKPVDRALVQRVIEIASTAPPGFPPHATEIVVIDRKQEVEHLAEALREGYQKLVKMYENPIGRRVIRIKRGEETMRALQSHVIPIIKENNAWFGRNGQDRYLYSAPVVMLFHACRWHAGYHESAMVAATYAMLAAHALKLGCTMLSIVPPLLNNMGKELRPRYGIAQDNHVVVALVLGYPKYKYRRVIHRQFKSVQYK
jgi:ferredoxin